MNRKIAKFKIGIVVGVGLVILPKVLIGANLSAGNPAAVKLEWTIHNPCTSNESWEVSHRVPSEFRTLEKLAKSPLDELAKGEVALNYATRSKNKTLNLLAQYVLARAAFNSQMAHSARDGFEKTVAGAAKIISQASLSCLYHIHQKIPAMEFSPGEQQVLLRVEAKTLPEGLAKKVEELKSRVIYRQLARGQNADKNSLKSEAVASFRNKNLAELMDAVATNDGEKILRITQGKQDFSVAVGLDSVKAFLHLVAARQLAASENLDSAVKEYQAIPEKSPWYATGIFELAHLEISRQRLNEAIAAMEVYKAKTQLDNPEAWLISAEAHSASCHFPEAKRLLERGLKGLDALSDSLAKLKSELARSDFKGADFEVKSLLGKPSPIVNLIDYSLGAYPQYRNGRGELAKIDNELKIITGIVNDANLRKTGQVASAIAFMQRKLLQEQIQLSNKLKSQLMIKIAQMEYSASELREQARGVRIDILSRAGEEKREDNPSQTPYLAGPMLAWDSRSALVDSPMEIWSDETGDFAVMLDNRCTP